MKHDNLYLNRNLEFLVADSAISIGNAELVDRARTAFNSKDYGSAVILYSKAWNSSGYLPIEDVDAMAECYGLIAEEAMNREDMKNSFRNGKIELELVANVLRTIIFANEVYEGRFDLKAWEMTEHFVRSNLTMAGIWSSDKWSSRRGTKQRYEKSVDFFIDGAETLFYLVDNGFIPENLLYATGNLAVEIGSKLHRISDACVSIYGTLLYRIASECASVLHTTDKSIQAEEISEKLQTRKGSFVHDHDMITA